MEFLFSILQAFCYQKPILKLCNNYHIFWSTLVMFLKHSAGSEK